jgi:hypothetical protein
MSWPADALKSQLRGAKLIMVRMPVLDEVDTA